MPQRLRVLAPPTMDELLADPIYRTYLARRPRLPDNLSHGCPWQVVALRRRTKKRPPWVSGMRPDYSSAVAAYKRLRDTGKFADVAIISRRMTFAPPRGFSWSPAFRWCGRCRRPSLFRLHEGDRHHALRHAVVLTADSPVRCFYCGIRETAVPRYPPRGAP